MSGELVNKSSIQSELNVKKLQLHWLLQITKAINYDLPAPQLFEVYQSVLKDHLKINKLILYIHEHQWHCMLKYGVADDFQIELNESRLAEISKVMMTGGEMPVWLSSFETIIPVNHNKQDLAFAFIGSSAHEDILNLKDVIPFIHTITNIIVVAIENKRLTKESIRQAQIEKELELAARMQSMLFPAHIPHNSRIDLAATYLPHQMVGGDYYDYIELNENELLICLADVSGKGISAALLMSNFQANLNAKAPLSKSLIDLVHDLNGSVNKSAKGEKFITVFIAIINTKNRVLKYVNAGHNPPLIYSGNEFHLLDKGTTGLGMFDELPFIHEGEISFQPGSTLFCYTDGVVEQENTSGDVFGVEVLMDLIQKNHQVNSMKDLHVGVINSFNEFKKAVEPIDDVTLLSCRMLI
ncbi:MAG: PP2C family protein-serine/threonine phosphatase [Bacteroidota bacterium]